jgi:hypothetical protein
MSDAPPTVDARAIRSASLHALVADAVKVLAAPPALRARWAPRLRQALNERDAE